jgi:hypothetical protein
MSAFALCVETLVRRVMREGEGARVRVCALERASDGFRPSCARACALITFVSAGDRPASESFLPSRIGYLAAFGPI